MKIQKTISLMFALCAVIFGGTKMAHAEIENPARVNAIAQARANAKTEVLSRGIANLCPDILAENPGENGGADCEERRSQCETKIREDFLGDIQERVEACSPENRPNECFLFNGLDIGTCLNQGFSQDECVEQCSDNSTPTSRCLSDINFNLRRAVAVAKYKSRLRAECRPEEVAEQPVDPIVDGAQDQNPNPGADVGNQAVSGNAAQNGTGGCSMNGMSSGAGNLSIYLLGFLPLAVAWIRKRK